MGIESGGAKAARSLGRVWGGEVMRGGADDRVAEEVIGVLARAEGVRELLGMGVLTNRQAAESQVRPWLPPSLALAFRSSIPVPSFLLRSIHSSADPGAAEFVAWWFIYPPACSCPARPTTLAKRLRLNRGFTFSCLSHSVRHSQMAIMRKLPAAVLQQLSQEKTAN